MNNQKGFILPIIIAVVVVVILGTGGYFAYKQYVAPKPENNQNQNGIACAQDAMQCPDGSYVGRVSPDCDFAPCPETQNSETAGLPVQSQQATEGWKTYKNNEYGFEIKYPKEASLNEWKPPQPGGIDIIDTISIAGYPNSGSHGDEWNVNISILKNYSENSLQQWTEGQYEECKKDEASGVAPCFMTSFSETFEKTDFNGYPAYKSHVIFGGYGDASINRDNNFVYYLARGNYIYTVANVAAWRESVAITKQVLSTFKFTK